MEYSSHMKFFIFLQVDEGITQLWLALSQVSGANRTSHHKKSINQSTNNNYGGLTIRWSCVVVCTTAEAQERANLERSLFDGGILGGFGLTDDV